MPEALVTLPDGRKAKVTFTDRAQLDATVADLTRQAGAGAPKTAPEVPGAAQSGPHGNVGVGVAETALKLGTGLASSAAGGVAGLARGAGAGIASLAQGEGLERARTAFTDEATQTIKDVGEAGTYQPRTTYGKLESAIAEAPFKLLAKGANVAGEKTAELTGSPAAGAAVNTAIQSVPALVGAKVGRMVAGEPGAAAGASSRGTAGTAAGRAEAYAGNLGLDWTRLPAELKTTLTRIAGEAGNLEKLNPEAVKRQALLQGQKIPIATTRGKLTRDPVELRREAVASTTAEGQPIRDIDIAANRDLQANLEVLRGKVAGKRGGLHDPNAEGAPAGPSIRAPTKAQTDVGASVQGELRGKAKASKAAYDALYKKARETDPEAKASVEPLTKMLAENPEIQHLGWMGGWLAKAAKAKQLATGAPEVEPITEAKLAELHDLRSTANDIARTGGKEGYYAGKVVKAIDDTMESVPEGAKAWKAANAAFKKHQQEFKDQSLIKQLTTSKGGDRAVALEKTWNTIAKAPVEKIRQVKQSLLTQEGPKSTRMQGRAAWRDLRGETVNRILEDARNVVATDETERSILTAAALRKSINSVGRERLTEILGKRNTDQLYDLLRAAKITRTDPAHRVTESGTVPNALVLAEKILKHIPGAKTVVGAKHAISDLTERGRAAEAVKQSTKTPLQVAAEEAERRASRRTLRLRRSDLARRVATGASPGAGTIGGKQE